MYFCIVIFIFLYFSEGSDCSNKVPPLCQPNFWCTCMLNGSGFLRNIHSSPSFLANVGIISSWQKRPCLADLVFSLSSFCWLFPLEKKKKCFHKGRTFCSLQVSFQRRSSFQEGFLIEIILLSASISTLLASFHLTPNWGVSKVLT